MEKVSIQYLWIQDWRNFKNTEMNFSEKYKIHYDNNYNLEINICENYEENFYGNNLDIAVIVGNNGIGKTSTLQFIMAFSKGDDHVNRDIGKFIVIYKVIDNKENEKLEVFYHDESDSLFSNECLKQLEKKNIFPEEIYPIKSKTSNKFFTFDTTKRKDIRYIYYSDVFNNTGMELTGQNILNPYYSLLDIIYKDENSENKYYKHGFLDKYWQQETQKQISFIAGKKKVIEEFGIEFPKKITIYVNRSNITKHYVNSDPYYESDVDNYFATFNDNDAFESLMAKEILYSLSFNEQIKNTYFSKSKNHIKYKTSLDCVCDILRENCKKEDNNYINKYLIFIDYYLNNVKKSKMFVHDRWDKHISFKIENKNERINLTTFLKFAKMYFDISNKENFLSFSWGLSSGEESLLNSFSRLYDLSETINGEQVILKEGSHNEEEENIILMYDEVEIALHPDWQKKYINSLIAFLNNMFKKTHIQLVLTTHSPIMLSDILRQNIIFLKRDEDGNTTADLNINHKQTFGSNIFRLYDDAFFLENGSMGSFAENKIVEIIDLIQDKKESNYEEIINKINLIGDDILRKKMLKLLYDNSSKANRIRELRKKKLEIEKEIERLKKDD